MLPLALPPAGGGSRPSLEVIGVPLDLGAGRRGVDMGPSAVRHAGLIAQLRALGYTVTDRGNISAPVAEALPPATGPLRYHAEVLQVCQAVRAAVLASLERGARPVLLGGDHSLAIGSLAALLTAYPDLRVLWLDAHGDLNTPKTTPSGNIHGMPLAVALGPAAPAFATLGWDRLRLPPEHLVLIGVRDLDPGEKQLIRDLNLRVYTMTDVDLRGLQTVLREALDYLAPPAGRLHVSIDLDVVDPLFAPGVGTPVDGGLTYREAHLTMEILATTGAVGSLEVVEVNPILDERNRTGLLAAGLILSALGKTIL